MMARMKEAKKIMMIVGTRPNFVKITQFPGILKKHSGKLHFVIVHTGQHFDDKMAKVFFEQFGIVPDIFLDVDPADAAAQMTAIRKELKKVMMNYQPDLVIVVGDVNSTLAGAEVANELKIKVAHIESGLRSFDR